MRQARASSPAPHGEGGGKGEGGGGGKGVTLHSGWAGRGGTSVDKVKVTRCNAGDPLSAGGARIPVTRQKSTLVGMHSRTHQPGSQLAASSHGRGDAHADGVSPISIVVRQHKPERVGQQGSKACWRDCRLSLTAPLH